MIYMMIKTVNKYSRNGGWKTYGYTINAGRSVDPWTRASRLGASLVWYTRCSKQDEDTANELELFWCASQYLKSAYSLFDFEKIDRLKGKKEMFGKFETYEEAKTYVDIIAKRYLTDFS